MQGFIKVEAVDGGISCECELKGVNFVDKAAIIAAVLQSLEINMSNVDELSSYIALAKVLAETGKTIKFDRGMISALKKMSDEKKKEEDG